MSFAAPILAAMVSIASVSIACSDEAVAETKAWRTSLFLGQKHSDTRKPTPCTCRFGGRDFHVGDQVCMNMPQNGMVVARCDLVDNVTSWVPTRTACTTS